MNYKKACQCLDIEFDKKKLDKIKLKRQYRLKALLYHPDKNNSVDAVSKFQEVHESYEYLLKYQDYMVPDIEYYNDYDCSDDSANEDEKMFSNINKNGYDWMLFSFLRNVLNKNKQNNLLYTIIQRISSICETNALDTLEKIDKNILIKIYDILKKYKEAFHFSEEFIIKIENIIANKIKNDECIILNPTLEDLFQNNLYRLTVNQNHYCIPLWHHELVYDNSGSDIYVKCNPILPENIEIDNQNNIHIHIEYKICEIWKESIIDVYLTNDNQIKITVNLLKLVEEQTIVFSNIGISKINTENVYDISKKSDIIIHLKLFL
uniref:J domain-containing protein n=1 Tax=viral metagenome TaxID=1070528 RepID=A0A6C0DJQ0_9ZZZZ